MTNYQPNVKNLKYIVEKAYVAATGEMDEEIKERLYAGVDAAVRLYQENPNIFYAVAAASLAEGAQAIGIKNDVVPMLVDYLIGRSRIKNNKDNFQGGK